jgi:CRP-like cAMP-binding protein
MQERRVAPDTVIYREGEPSPEVYLIQAGEVEVLRHADGRTIRLARLGAGQIFGEMGVIRDKPRSTTVRAVSEVKLLALPRDKFLETFSTANPMALKVLRSLCERLRNADSQIAGAAAPSDPARADRVARIRLLAATRALAAQIGDEGVEVASLPFALGRRTLSGEDASDIAPELALATKDHHQLSPLHFAIEDDNGYLVVRDLGSHLGTMVNGTRIAEFENESVAELHFGANEVQTGGVDSPFRFDIIVEKKTDSE